MYLSRIRLALQRRASKWLARRPVLIHLERPIVSFTFDDFPRSALHLGGKILENFGARGTYYTSLGLAGMHTPTGEMFTINDISELIAGGHELGCHTFDHCPAWDTSARNFMASVQRNRNALQSIAADVEMKTLSYPISTPNPSTKRQLTHEFNACRAGGQRFNAGIADANYLKSFFLEKARNEPSIIESVIDATLRHNGWLIFSTHDISTHPTRFGCTPVLLKRIVGYCRSKDVSILPVSEAMKIATGP